LHYFWAVAKEGNLSRTAQRLRVAQSALSSQIRQLERSLGEELFRREGRLLVLTEAGQIAFRYAEEIFATGESLLATLKDGRRADELVCIGAVATLSRNFQESFVKPILLRPNAKLRLQAGRLEDLLRGLTERQLDVVLSNRVPRREANRPWRVRRLARQPVSIVGPRRKKKYRFPDDVAKTPLLLPGLDSEIRSEFDALCEKLGVAVKALAEVDDMATLRLLARDSGALALLPSVVVRDELREGTLVEHCVVPELFETFYGITIPRQFEHPLVRDLLRQEEEDLLFEQGGT
jgi:LysR family transcriptional activator of nhaA